MKSFRDESGAEWTASSREEVTPRHHGRWYLIFQGPDGELAMPEVRWQTSETARRTLLTMSDFELRRRLHIVRERALLEEGASPVEGAPPEAMRARTSVNAG